MFIHGMRKGEYLYFLNYHKAYLTGYLIFERFQIIYHTYLNGDNFSDKKNQFIIGSK
jgi:hypothetical protein